MPKLKEALENAKKSVNKLWKKKTIRKYQKIVDDYIRDDPEREFKLEVIELQKQIDLQIKKRNFAKLPEEYPFLEKEIIINGQEVYSVMTAFFPPPAPYKEGCEFSDFLKSVERYAKIVKADSVDEKKNILIYLLGSNAYKLEEALGTVAAGTDITWDIIKTKGCEAFSHTQHEAMALFFAKRQGGENSEEYLEAVKTLANAAKIKDETIIVNRMIEGLRDKTVKFELLKLKITSVKEVLTQVKFLNSCQQNNNQDQINKVSGNYKNKKNNYNKDYKKQNNDNQKPQSDKKQNEKSDKCCFFCKKPGHFKKNCFNYKKWLNKKSNNDVSGAGQSNDIGSLFKQ